MGKYRRGRVDMKILIIGGGGREHAIAWKLSKSPRVEKIYCAPGNAGIAEIAECVNIGVMEFDRQVAFAKEHGIDLTVVAPDDPLAAGAVDAFEAAGLRAFGPRANGLRNLHRPGGGHQIPGNCQNAHRIKGRRPGSGKRRFNLQ